MDDNFLGYVKNCISLKYTCDNKAFLCLFFFNKYHPVSITLLKCNIVRPSLILPLYTLLSPEILI